MVWCSAVASEGSGCGDAAAGKFDVLVDLGSIRDWVIRVGAGLGSDYGRAGAGTADVAAWGGRGPGPFETG